MCVCECVCVCVHACTHVCSLNSLYGQDFMLYNYFNYYLMQTEHASWLCNSAGQLLRWLCESVLHLSSMSQLCESALNIVRDNANGGL